MLTNDLQASLVDFKKRGEDVTSDQQNYPDDDQGIHQPLFLVGHQVIDINAGPNDPSPRLETFDIGDFVHRLFHPGLGPLVMNKPSAIGTDLVNKPFKKSESIWIFDSTGVLAIQLWFDGMHDDIGSHVVDPEVFRFVIAQLRNGVFGHCLSLIARHLS